MQQLNPRMVMIGAGAVFAGCALLLVCGLLALTAANIITPNREPTPTVTVVSQERTAQPTRTPIGLQATPTQLPLLTPGQRPVTLPTAILPPAILPPVDPAQAVRDYYDLVSQGRYDRSWPLLSDAFKQTFNCCAPNYDYAGYVAWWDSVDHVAFGDVRTMSQGGGRALVYAELFYHMQAGGVSSDNEPYIELVYDAARAVWLFDDKGADPGGRR